MKKLTFAALTALLLVFQHNIGFSQRTQSTVGSTASIEQAKAFHVNSRVLASFSAAFTGISNAAWCPSDNGFMARFVKDSIQHFAYFAKNGRLESLVRYYHKNDLPAVVAAQIKDAYRPLSIGGVKEVTYEGITAYLVTVDYGSTWQIIRYVNGEMDVWESYVKG